jgi:hypothetical protein
MRGALRFRPSAARGLAVVALLAALGGAGYAVRGADAKQVVTKFYSPRDWQPQDSSTSYGTIGKGQVLCRAAPGAVENVAFFDLRFDVPDGATITRITYYFTDADPAGELEFFVASSEAGGAGAYQSVKSTDRPSGGFGSVELNPLPAEDGFPQVNNARLGYFMSAAFRPCNGNESRFLDGVRIEYVS